MDQDMVDVDVTIGPLWIRRQVFEHSVAVPLLTAATASQIDFPRLAAELVSSSVVSPPEPPAVTYDAWVAAAGLHARLDSSEHAAIIVEALETNVPEAFRRCNDRARMNSTEQLPNRQLLIPVPELLAFIKLHAAATVSTLFRNSADSVWPDADAPTFPLSPIASTAIRSNAPSSPLSSPNPMPISLTPASPRVQSLRPSPSHSSASIQQNFSSSEVQVNACPPNMALSSRPADFQSTGLQESEQSCRENDPKQKQPQQLQRQHQKQHDEDNALISQQLQRQAQTFKNQGQEDQIQQQRYVEKQTSQKQPHLNQEEQQKLQHNQSPQPQHPEQSEHLEHLEQSQQSQQLPLSQQLQSELPQTPQRIQQPNVPQQPQQQLQQQLHQYQHQQQQQQHQQQQQQQQQQQIQLQQQLQQLQHQQILQQHQATLGSLSPSCLASSSNSIDALVRKKSPNHISPIMNSQSSIIASVQYALERETRLVTSNLKALLLVIAASYGIPLDEHAESVTQEPDYDVRGAGVAESGTLTDVNPEKGRSQPAGITNSPPTSRKPDATKYTASDAVMADKNGSNGGVSKPLPASNVSISRDMFEHLSFLLTTTSEPNEPFRPMSTIVPQWSDKHSTSTVALVDLVDIVTTALTRVPIQEVYQGVIDLVEICDVERRTIIRSKMPQTNIPDDGKQSQAPDVRISNCSDAHIYFLCALGRVSFVGCRSCTLFLGGCVSLSLINCENVRVHAVSRVCRVTNCFDTHLYLCTNTSPQIVGENRGLVFAPYNAAYPRAELDKHSKEVGVDITRNMWDKFFRPAFRGSNTDRGTEVSTVVARTLAPEQFLPFGVPVRYKNGAFVTEKDTEALAEQERIKGKWESSLKCLFGVSAPLPSIYEEQLKQKRLSVVTVRNEIRGLERQWVEAHSKGKDMTSAEGKGSESGSEGEETKEGDNDKHFARQIGGGVVHSIVQERFREWLTNSGRIKQISDLVRTLQES